MTQDQENDRTKPIKTIQNFEKALQKLNIHCWL
jgi:hypothetical protein